MSSSGSGADHPVFTRLSRQQLIVRRRSIGFQTLTYVATMVPTRCKHCGRQLNALWKELLCHVCGFWVCHHCSSVIEREREMHVIHFVRACVACLSIVNKWSDPELVTELASSPWVEQSSKCQLALHLADTLRTKPELRSAVLVLLGHLGHIVDVNAAMLLAIKESDWATTSAGSDCSIIGLDSSLGSRAAHTSSIALASLEAELGRDSKQSAECECAQLLVQQCFEVAVPELPVDACVFAEADGSRQYPIYFDDRIEAPAAPVGANESVCSACIASYDLLGRDVNTSVMQLICDLAAKEFDATNACVTVLSGAALHTVAVPPGGERDSTARSQTFCAFAAMAPLPFLVRDAALDIRFRNFEIVRGSEHLHFYASFPIRAQSGTPVALLCVVDTKPRKHVTTMQYSIMRKLADVISAIWADEYAVAESAPTQQQHELETLTTETHAPTTSFASSGSLSISLSHQSPTVDIIAADAAATSAVRNEQ